MLADKSKIDDDALFAKAREQEAALRDALSIRGVAPQLGDIYLYTDNSPIPVHWVVIGIIAKTAQEPAKIVLIAADQDPLKRKIDVAVRLGSKKEVLNLRIDTTLVVPTIRMNQLFKRIGIISNLRYIEKIVLRRGILEGRGIDLDTLYLREMQRELRRCLKRARIQRHRIQEQVRGLELGDAACAMNTSPELMKLIQNNSWYSFIYDHLPEYQLHSLTPKMSAKNDLLMKIKNAVGFDGPHSNTELCIQKIQEVISIGMPQYALSPSKSSFLTSVINHLHDETTAFLSQARAKSQALAESSLMKRILRWPQPRNHQYDESTTQGIRLALGRPELSRKRLRPWRHTTEIDHLSGLLLIEKSMSQIRWLTQSCDLLPVEDYGPGGIGYRVISRASGRRYALRVLSSGLLPRKERDALRSELQQLCGVSHPAIAQVYAVVDRENGEVHVLQEDSAQINLHTWLEGHGPVPLSKSLRICSQIAEAVSALHRSRVSHGCLHTRTICIQSVMEEKVYLKDNGLTKWFYRTAAHAPSSHSVQHHAMERYLAPEEYASADGITQQADIYALGCIFEQVLGLTSSQEVGVVALETARKTRGGYADQALDREVRERLQRILLQMKQNQPRDRPSASYLVEEFMTLSLYAGLRQKMPGHVQRNSK